MPVLFLIVMLFGATQQALAQNSSCTNATDILTKVVQEFDSTEAQTTIAVQDVEIKYHLLWILPISIKLRSGRLADMKTLSPNGDIWLCNLKNANSTADIPTVLSNFTFTNLTVNYPDAQASFLFFTIEGSLTVEIKNNKFEFSGSCKDAGNKTEVGELNYLAVRNADGFNVNFESHSWFRWPIISLADHVLHKTDNIVTASYGHLTQMFGSLSTYFCQVV